MIVEYTKQKGGIDLIHLWWRNLDNSLEHEIFEFEPRFYDERLLNNPLIIRHETVNKKSIHNKPLYRYYVKTSGDVPKCKTHTSHSADILLDKVYFAEEITEAQIAKAERLLYIFDIETDSESGSSIAEEATSPIISLALKDSDSDKPVVLVWRADLENEKVERRLTKNSAGEQVEFIVKMFDNEKDLLSMFITTVSHYDPDDFWGWNPIKFDMLYIFNRLLHHDFSKEAINSLGRLGAVFIKGGKVSIRGRRIFDGIEYLKKVSFEKFKDFSLNEVSKHLKLKNSKIKLDVLPGVLWREDLDALIEYNLFDVLSVEEILYEYNVYGKVRRLQMIAHSPIQDLLFPTFSIDSYLLYKCRNKVVLPNRPKGAARMKMGKASGHGGLVLPPIPGIHLDVACLDWASLYPIIIKAFNMSPENAYSGDMDISHLKNPCTLNNGVTFDLDADAILASTIVEIIDYQINIKKERDSYKYGSDKYKELQMSYDAYKAFRNSFFGVMKQPSFRLSSLDVFKSITYIGRGLLRAIKELVESLEGEIVYGDTDSVFLRHKNPQKIADIINNSIEKFLATLCDNPPKKAIENNDFNIQYEKHYERIFFKMIKGKGKAAKKNYGGLLVMKNGKVCDEIDVVGFKRRDVSSKGTKLFEELLEKALRTGSKLECDKILTMFLKDVRELDINNLDSVRDVCDYLRSQTLSKSLQSYRPTQNMRIRGAYYSNQNFGFVFNGFERLYVMPIISIKGYPPTQYISFTREQAMLVPWDKIEIDVKEIWRMTFATRMETVYDGSDWQTTISGLKIVEDAW